MIPLTRIVSSFCPFSSIFREFSLCFRWEQLQFDQHRLVSPYSLGFCCERHNYSDMNVDIGIYSSNNEMTTAATLMTLSPWSQMKPAFVYFYLVGVVKLLANCKGQLRSYTDCLVNNTSLLWYYRIRNYVSSVLRLEVRC